MLSLPPASCLLLIFILLGYISNIEAAPEWSISNISYFGVSIGESGDWSLRKLPKSHSTPMEDPTAELYVLLHGLGGTAHSPFNQLISKALLSQNKKNILIVDYSELVPARDYNKAANSVHQIGEELARYLAGVLVPIWLIGFSIGAQVAGVAGHRLMTRFNVTLDRIIALDPTDVMFTDLPTEDRLDRSDAGYVMAVHTGGGAVAGLQALGHADFYPNSGLSPQPHCKMPSGSSDSLQAIGFRLLVETVCSHSAAYVYLAESVGGGFTATRCDGWWKYLSGRCEGEPTVPMGFNVPSNFRGRFFLRTRKNEPFGEDSTDYEDLSKPPSGHSEAASSDAERRDPTDLWGFLNGLVILAGQGISIYLIWTYTPH